MATHYMTFNISQVIQNVYKLLGSVTHNPDGTHYMTFNISQVIQNVYKLLGSVTHNPDGTPLYDI